MKVSPSSSSTNQLFLMSTSESQGEYTQEHPAQVWRSARHTGCEPIQLNSSNNHQLVNINKGTGTTSQKSLPQRRDGQQGCFHLSSQVFARTAPYVTWAKNMLYMEEAGREPRSELGASLHCLAYTRR